MPENQRRKLNNLPATAHSHLQLDETAHTAKRLSHVYQNPHHSPTNVENEHTLMQNVRTPNDTRSYQLRKSNHHPKKTTAPAYSANWNVEIFQPAHNLVNRRW